MTIRDVFDKYDTDKAKYTNFYDFWLPQIKPKVLLEIGVQTGGSIFAFQDYFPDTEIYGIDFAPIYKAENVFIGDQIDTVFLQSVIDRIGAPDIIIDDGGHYSSQIITSFEFLFPKLNNGGFYIIEDLLTSYPLFDPRYVDHDPTAVGYLKNLIDEINFHGCGAWQSEDYPLEARTNDFQRTIKSLNFGNHIALIQKM